MVPSLGVRGRVRRVLEVLARERAINLKEVLESFEVYACVRRRLKQPEIVDLCCGHGLTGLLFALFGREVRRVTLVDREISPCSMVLSEALHDAFPELKGRVRRMTCALEEFSAESSQRDTGYLAVHACGSRTDVCLNLALRQRAPIVVVPCCYSGTGQTEPPALRKSLGVALAADIGRTYRLQAAGYRVEWDTIPAAVTPMNRVLLAFPTGGLNSLSPCR